MATLLGTPYKRGKSDVINAYEKPETFIEEGLAVVETSNVTIAKATGSNGIVCGVMGHTEHKGASAVKAGQEVAVQLDSGVASISDGDSVYVTPNGQFSNTDNSSANTQVNAIFVKVDGAYIHTDGKVSGASARSNQSCAFISFVGGL